MMNKKKDKHSGLPNYKHLFPTIFLAMVITFLVGAVLFVFLKDQFYNPSDPASNTSLYDIAQTTVVAMGALTVGGAAIIQYRRHRVLEVQAGLDRENRFVERLTKAIDHLGNDKVLSIRIGAIYELKLLALDWDDEEARNSIVEILTAFVRGKIEQLAAAEDEEPREEQPRPENDVFTACTVLSALRDEFTVYIDLNLLNAIDIDLSRINLNEAHLEGANLEGARLIGARLHGAHLEWAYLTGAYLTGAYLEEAHLKGAHLEGAHLIGAYLIVAHLIGAHLEGAHLIGAYLEGAYLEGAHLEGALLRGAHLEGALLRGARLEGANLEYANLEGADLSGAYLNARQLLSAFVDNTTILDDDIRAEYEALKASESED